MANIFGLTREELGFPTDMGGIQLAIEAFDIEGVTDNLYTGISMKPHLTILHGVPHSLRPYRDLIMSRYEDLGLVAPTPEKPWNLAFHFAEVFGLGETVESVVFRPRVDVFDGAGPEQLSNFFNFLPHWRDFPSYKPYITFGVCLPGLGSFAAKELNEILDERPQLVFQATDIEFY